MHDPTAIAADDTLLDVLGAPRTTAEDDHRRAALLAARLNPVAAPVFPAGAATTPGGAG